MALTTIYPKGVAEITIPATESIAISNYGGGIASIYYLIQNSNRPAAWQLQQTLENSGVVLGAFASGKNVKIEAGNSTIVYDVGASPDTGIGDADTLGGNPPSYYAVDSDVVHDTADAAWTAPTLLNSWVNYGGDEETAGYRKNSENWVIIKGTVKSGTVTPGTAIFNIPAGYRPLKNHIFAQDCSGAFGAVSVALNGNVFVSVAAANTLLTINCVYLAEQ